MKKLILIGLIILLIPVSSSAGIVGGVKKIIDTEWVKKETLRVGTISSLCVYQTFIGFTEGYRFKQAPTHFINEGNYHTFALGQRISGIATGWFGYANYRDKNQTWFDRIRRSIGGGLVARNFMEWSYRYSRYGTPFEYSEARNQHSIVYFGFRDGKLTDLYIGTGPVTGPLVDILFMGLGILIYK